MILIQNMKPYIVKGVSFTDTDSLMLDFVRHVKAENKKFSNTVKSLVYEYMRERTTGFREPADRPNLWNMLDNYHTASNRLAALRDDDARQLYSEFVKMVKAWMERWDVEANIRGWKNWR